jgi:thiol-disulfide isomerase/thioredoxin
MAERTSASRIGSTVVFFAAAALVAGLLSRPGSSPLEGKSAADFTLASVSDATRFRLADQRGTPVLIEVFASWCSVCRHAAPTMAEAAAAKRSGAVRFVGVSVDDTSEVAERTKRAWGIPYDVLLDDGRFTRAYDVKLLPTFILVGADGAIKKAASGALSESEIESWLSGVGASRL